MSSDRNIDNRLQPLLSAMLDGEPTDQQIAELRRLLRDVPEARRQYFRLLAAPRGDEVVVHLAGHVRPASAGRRGQRSPCGSSRSLFTT